MKIPETSANVGAYYGNEENGQWQPNGVIIDSGVGGGVVGSGDAGVQRAPLYPVHMPREHIPGYVMAGAYYPPAYPAAPVPDDFADYMWMENEEEFDKQVMQQLEEEALMEQCIEAMLEDEQRERHRPNGHHPQQYPTTSNGAGLSLEETVSRSRLNPLAAEFVPTNTAATATQLHTAPHTEEKSNTAEVSTAEPTPQKAEEAPAEHTDTHTEPQTDPTPPPTDPPEVSAADIQTDDKRRDKHKKPEPKKQPPKDTKPKAKPVPAKSETKVVKKEDVKKKEGKEVRVAKSEDAVEDSTPDVKPQPAPVEEPSGPKPINYAAAAKANKPKKPSSPPSDKASPPPAPAAPPAQKTEKKKIEKPAAKTDKPIQRKNSAK